MLIWSALQRCCHKTWDLAGLASQSLQPLLLQNVILPDNLSSVNLSRWQVCPLSMQLDTATHALTEAPPPWQCMRWCCHTCGAT